MVPRIVSSVLLLLASCGDADRGRRVETIDADALEDVLDVVDVAVTRPELAAEPSTAGTELWVGFMENLSLASNGPPTFAFFVSAPGASARVIGHAEVPQTGYSQAFEVPVGEVVKVTMPSGILYPQLNEVPVKLGVRLTAEAPIDVVAMHYRVYFSEATRILPKDELGDEYVVVTALDVPGESPTSVVVVATEDDTTFELEPSTVTTGFLSTGVAHRFTLQRGEMMQFQAGGDLSGTRVKSTGGQRLAVFAGARQAHVGCRGADSHLWDQMIPLARWGTTHVVVPMRGAGATPIKVVADRSKTVVSLSCQDDVIVNPGMGAQLSVARPSVITANDRIGVVALIKSNNCNLDANGDPNMVVVPPLGLTTRALAWTALSDFETLTNAEHSLNVVVGAADASGLLLDGVAVVGLAPFPERPDLMFAQLAVDAGTHRLTSSAGFQASVYGVAQYEAYSFTGGWDCTSCDALGAPTVPTGCDAGDLRLDRVPDGPDGTPDDPDKPDPEVECETACDCYPLHPLVDICGGSGSPDEPRAIWSCDGTCRPACGSPCEACPDRFPTNDGRCP